MTHKREVLVFPDLHIDHCIWILDLPEDECDNHECSNDEKTQYIWRFPAIGCIPPETA